MKPLWVVFLLLFFPLFNLKGEEITWIDFVDEEYCKIELQDGSFYTKPLTGSKKWNSQGKMKLIDVEDITIVTNQNNIQFFEREGRRYLYLAGRGKLYEVDRVNHAFIELVGEKDFGMDFLSQLFFFENQLYKLGGSGFWSHRSSLYRFNFNGNKWEKIQTEGESPHGLHKELYSIDVENGVVYAIDLLYQMFDKPSDNIYVRKLSLKDFKWELIGEIRDQNLFDYFYGYLVVINFKLEENPLILTKKGKFILDLIHNQLYEYSGNQNFMFHHKKYAEFTKNGKNFILVGYQNDRDISVGNKFLELGINDLLKDAKNVGRVYEKTSQFFQFETVFHGFTLVILSGFLILFYRKSEANENMEISENDRIYYKLKELKQKSLSTEELNQLILIDTKAADTQRQYRAKFIKDFNKFMKENHQIYEAISRDKDPSDNRYTIYRINF